VPIYVRADRQTCTLARLYRYEECFAGGGAGSRRLGPGDSGHTAVDLVTILTHSGGA
jgi:hypothetical protein